MKKWNTPTVEELNVNKTADEYFFAGYDPTKHQPGCASGVRGWDTECNCGTYSQS